MGQQKARKTKRTPSTAAGASTPIDQPPLAGLLAPGKGDATTWDTTTPSAAVVDTVPEDQPLTAQKNDTHPPKTNRRCKQIQQGPNHTKKVQVATSSTADALRETDVLRLGKDEMNLVEYPFVAMWRSGERHAVIELEWEARHPDTRKPMKAVWRVVGDPQLGLPTAADECVYLVLLELTREANAGQFQDPRVYFTAYDVLKRLGWDDGHKSYEALFGALQRLKTVTITARNTFWNPQTRSFRNVVFSIIDNVDMTPQRPGRKKKNQPELPTSFFRWNEVVFESFQDGYIRSIDLGFVLSLRGDITRRLYRYLDRKRHDGKRTFEIEIGVLCTRHLGMQSAAYPSKYKERLAQAHSELLKHGFLLDVRYEPMKTRSAEKVCYRFATPGSVTHSLADNDRPAIDAASKQDSPKTPAKTQWPQATPSLEPTQNTTPSDARDGDAISKQSQSRVRDTAVARTDSDEQGSDNALSHPHTAADNVSHTIPFNNTVANNTASAGKSQNSEVLPNSETPQQADLLQRLQQVGVTLSVAQELIAAHAPQAIHLQLECLNDRAPKNPAATLVQAIRQEWSSPPAYEARLETQERAQHEKQAQEEARRRKAAVEAKEREDAALLEQETVRLDALWDKLDPQTRTRIEREAEERLGVLGRLGRAGPAALAMRRNLLRELLDKPD